MPVPYVSSLSETFADLTFPQNSAAFDLQVAAGSPAEKAGLRSGDVITGMLKFKPAGVEGGQVLYWLARHICS